jgi:hypothetical protein
LPTVPPCGVDYSAITYLSLLLIGPQLNNYFIMVIMYFSFDMVYMSTVTCRMGYTRISNFGDVESYVSEKCHVGYLKSGAKVRFHFTHGTISSRHWSLVHFDEG